VAFLQPLPGAAIPYSDTSNLSCASSTQYDNTIPLRLRSAFPYLTPLTAQLAPPRAAGTTRSTITPAKVSNSGWLALTASVNDCSRSARFTGLRWGRSSLFVLKINLFPMPLVGLDHFTWTSAGARSLPNMRRPDYGRCKNPTAADIGQTTDRRKGGFRAPKYQQT